MRKPTPTEVNHDAANTDAAISRDAQRGDKRAWRALIRRHTPMVYRLSLRMLGSGSDAEDAVQEVFMKVHRSLHTYDASRPLKPWLGTITYHICLKRLSKVQRQGLPTDPATFLRIEDDAEDGPESGAAARQAGQLVAAAMDQLSAQDRALVTLKYREGMTDVEVGDSVGMNRNTVRTRLFRARAVLRRALGPALRGDRHE